MEALDKVCALEKRLVGAARKRSEAAEAVEVKRWAIATQFAKSMPTLSEEVDRKLADMVAGHLARIPEGDAVSRAHVERACRNAWIATMLKAKAEFQAASRGPGNRHDRRAATKKGARVGEIAR